MFQSKPCRIQRLQSRVSISRFLGHSCKGEAGLSIILNRYLAASIAKMLESGYQACTNWGSKCVKKTSLVMLCSIGCLTWTGSVMANENVPESNEASTSTLQTNHLRKWSILPKEVGNVELQPDTSNCAIVPKAMSRNLLFLLRPEEDGCRGHLSAIAEVKPNGSVILNPDGFNYGPIPDLKELTPDQADQLWSQKPNEETSQPKRTYKLLARNNETVFLDLKFRNGQLQKYRIRGALVKTERWNQVQ